MSEGGRYDAMRLHVERLACFAARIGVAMALALAPLALAVVGTDAEAQPPQDGPGGPKDKGDKGGPPGGGRGPGGFGGPGAGGRVQEFDWDGEIVWDYTFKSDKQSPHHDITRLPNGNVLMIVSDRKTSKEAIDAGRVPATVKDSS